MNNSGDLRSGTKPPQYSLRTLLLLVTLCAVVFALINVLPPMAMAGLVFLLITILAHIAGNAIGTRLREMGSRRADAGSAAAEEVGSEGQGGAPRCAPRTELSQRQSLGRPVLVVTAAGFLIGGIGGGIWTAWASGEHIVAAGVAIGSVACAVLGGFAAFLAFSFAQVGLSALRQALGSARVSTEEANG